MNKVVVVIPARYASSRLPGKMLVLLAGKPMIQWVWEGVSESSMVERVIIATDDECIREAADGFGAEAVMTDPELPSGTDRVAAAVKEIDVEWIVNVQGDEPMIRGEHLDEFISGLGDSDMATVARAMGPEDNPQDPNVVKVVSGYQGDALYFSRSPVPYVREESDREGALDWKARGAEPVWWHHLGIYAYRKPTLEKLVSLPPSSLEQLEKLEQLRALQNGIAIKVIPTSFISVGVDTPEDVKRVEALLSS